MGGCLSTQAGFVPVKPRLRRRRSWIRKRIASKTSRVLGYNKVSKDAAEEHSGLLDLDAPLAETVDVMWFDPNTLYESESEDEEYLSAPDVQCLNDWEDSSSSELLFPKDAMKDEKNPDMHTYFSCNLMTMPKDFPSKDVAHKSETSRKAQNKVFVDDMKSVDKKRAGISSPTSARSKVAPDLFMSFEGQNNALLLSSKMIRKRPVAGTTFPICPGGKEMYDSWSPIDPSTFRVRGANYPRDKKREHASSKAAYYPFGVDVYKSHRKISHIARLVELPAIDSSTILPAILVVNVQIPLYRPSIFQTENNGEGMNVVMYFKLSEKFEKELPLHFQESIKRLIDNEVEKIKAFPMDTTAPFRERLKILGKVSNADHLRLNVAQRRLMRAYNDKPVLSRPQHEFFSGENYFEIDLDMHRFSYISRKRFNAFQDKLRICILDLGLTIQGNRSEELPEQLLCSIRLNGIDHTKYRHLAPSEEIL